MKLSVSNIAWSFSERLDAYAILGRNDFTGLEIAPGLLFGDSDSPFSPNKSLLRSRKDELNAAGLELCSMQSLLFGVDNIALFEGAEKRENLIHALRRTIDLAEQLEIPNLVFGSPKNRAIPGDMCPESAQKIALDTFNSLGDYAASAGTSIALEANPKIYGTNFLNHFLDSAELASRLSHPAISVNFDIGSFLVNQEEEMMASLFTDHASLVTHVHVSEPYLAPAPEPRKTSHFGDLLKALSRAEYDKYVSIEMRRQDDNLMTLENKCIWLKSAVSSSQSGRRDD